LNTTTSIANYNRNANQQWWPASMMAAGLFVKQLENSGLSILSIKIIANTSSINKKMNAHTNTTATTTKTRTNNGSCVVLTKRQL